MRVFPLPRDRKNLKELLAIGLATVLGVGYFPRMPGTAGSLFALLVYWIFFPNESSLLIHAIFFGIMVLLFFIGVWSSTIAEHRYGHDPSCVVIDEVTGMALALWLLPKYWLWTLAAFLIFRLLDIFKWLGIHSLQTLRGGWGVMMDDLLAGLWTNGIVHLMIWSHRFIHES